MRTKSLHAAVLIVSFAFPAQVLAQTSSFVAPGRVEGAGPSMSIGVAAAGTVSEIMVHEGSRIRAGQTLLKLDCGPTEADIRTQEAHLAAAQASFDRASNGSRPDEIAVGEAVVGCQIALNPDPLLARKNDPSEIAETGGAELQIAEQSRSWRAAIGEREVMRGS
jgi:multidrug efflux pump subunit AcrA (membrane-fusion protein)